MCFPSLCLLLLKCHFTLTDFNTFPMSLVFRNLIMIYVSVDFFGFLLFGFHSASGICRQMALGKFWIFCHYFFTNFLALYSSRTLMTQMLEPLLYFHRFLNFSYFFSLFSLYLPDQTFFFLIHWFFPLSLPFCCWTHSLGLYFSCCVFQFYNLDWIQWLTPVVPVLREIKVGGLLETGSLRPVWAR